MNTVVINQMIDYIENHLLDEITLNDIASAVNYSPFYCSTSFRKALGTSIKMYIARRRLYLAAEALLNFRGNILQLAIKYGYSSQEAFTRAFVKAYGVTPLKFKREALVAVNYHERRFTLSENKQMKNDAIKHIHETIATSYQSSVLHILNGQCMLQAFRENNWMAEDAMYIPFNEAMCWGEGSDEIFSEAFMQARSQSLKSSVNMYKDIVVKALQPLFEEAFDTIVLWFGTDMFCQMNMLTILGYLDQIGYEGDVLFCLEDEVSNEMLPDAKAIEVKGFYDHYKSIVCDKKPVEGLMPIMYQGVQAYLSYRKADSEINKYIKAHINEEDLLQKVMKTFPEYGLGDLQFKMMIEAMDNLISG